MEEQAERQGTTLREMTPEQTDRLWNEAKAAERNTLER